MFQMASCCYGNGCGSDTPNGVQTADRALIRYAVELDCGAEAQALVV
jgi:hypothetical protein